MEKAATYRESVIPGTTVFTGARSQKGYRINKLAMSLTDSGRRSIKASSLQRSGCRGSSPT
jgi:hypothetical protein